MFLSRYPSATQQQARDALVNNATNGKVIDAKPSSPNKLLHVPFIGNGDPPPR